MVGFINVIYESVIASVATVFFLIEDCKDKKKGIAAHFVIELVKNYILLRILRMTETGIALPEIIVWRVVLYVVYMTFRLGWFRLFTGNCYRNFLLVYFYTWGSAYIVVSGAYWVWSMIFPEELDPKAVYPVFVYFVCDYFCLCRCGKYFFAGQVLCEGGNVYESFLSEYTFSVVGCLFWIR